MAADCPYILIAFTIPEVITLVLHPVFQRAAVDEALGGPRNLTVLQREKIPSLATSGRLLRRLTLTSVAIALPSASLTPLRGGGPCG